MVDHSTATSVGPRRVPRERPRQGVRNSSKCINMHFSVQQKYASRGCKSPSKMLGTRLA